MRTFRSIVFSCLFLGIMALCPSCWLVYKPVPRGTYARPGSAPKIINTPNCSFDVLLFAETLHDTCYVSVRLDIHDIKRDVPVVLSGLRLSVGPYPEKPGIYVLQKIRIRKGTSVETLHDTAMAGPLSLELASNQEYDLNYTFFILGKHPSHHKMQVKLEGTITANGRSEAVREDIVFKRHLYVDIAGN